MLVPLPIGFLLAALLSDIGFLATDDVFWARCSVWLIAAGIAAGLLAAIPGAIDFGKIRQARSSIGWVHAGGNVTVVIISVVNLILRLNDPVPTVTGLEAGLSLLVGLTLMVTGWLGGELVFRHKIAQADGLEASAEVGAVRHRHQPGHASGAR
jgi:uncharacterized membrane protein